MRGMIQADMSERYKEMLYPDLVANFNSMFQEMALVNKAHTIMLFQRKILDVESAQEILGAINDIQKNFTVEDLSPDNQDLYFNIEKAVIDRIGSTFGGRMHTGRSRNDLYSTLTRMTLRKSLWEIFECLLSIEERLVSLAREHTESVMTGYTHSQPAQPTTLAHYFLAYLQTLGRDFLRLRQAYETTNQCPLGAAAFAGTGFPLDRGKTAEMLGFDGVLENTWDCVASRDYLLQAESAVSIMMSSLGRVAQDIYFWCSEEVGVWEIGGEVAGQSSIMPQKKNPSTVEYIRGKSGHSFGAFASSYMAFKGIPFSFCCDMMETAAMFPKAHQETLKAMEMFEETLKYSKFNQKKALEKAQVNFCTVTGLADYLVRAFNISFRDAHRITGGMVADAKAEGKDVRGLDTAQLGKWSQKILGQELFVDDEMLVDILSPQGNVESKTVPGSPSKVCVEEMIRKAEAALREQREWFAAVTEKVACRYAETDAEALRILKLNG